MSESRRFSTSEISEKKRISSQLTNDRSDNRDGKKYSASSDNSKDRRSKDHDNSPEFYNNEYVRKFESITNYYHHQCFIRSLQKKFSSSKVLGLILKISANLSSNDFVCLSTIENDEDELLKRFKKSQL